MSHRDAPRDDPEPHDAFPSCDAGTDQRTASALGYQPGLDGLRAVSVCFVIAYHAGFRWFAGGWKVNADLPTTEAFDAATQFVRPEDVAEQIACGPDLDAAVESVRAYWEAGFTDVAIV